MAIIKCPECGHPVSDKAPTCPNCGVEIAGKVNLNVPQQNIKENINTPKSENPKPKKGISRVLIVSFVIALITCGVVFYFYHDAQTSKEQEAYEYAMNSTVPAVLQSYLDTYKDASEAHIDSIQAHLNSFQQVDKDWTNALVSNSKSALQDYLDKHPDSPYKAVAEHKIDSIDWVLVSTTNTSDVYNKYLEDHPNGEHVDEAKDGIKNLNAKTVQPEERVIINGLFRNFFQSINSRDEQSLMSTCEGLLTSFLGKTDATKSDVVTFLNKIWKDDMTNMNWHINNDYKIDKKEVGDGEYEYTVTFSAIQSKEFNDASKNGKSKFRISAKVSPNDRISSFNMTKIVE